MTDYYQNSAGEIEELCRCSKNGRRQITKGAKDDDLHRRTFGCPETEKMKQERAKELKNDIALDKIRMSHRGIAKTGMKRRQCVALTGEFVNMSPRKFKLNVKKFLKAWMPCPECGTQNPYGESQITHPWHGHYYDDKGKYVNCSGGGMHD